MAFIQPSVIDLADQNNLVVLDGGSLEMFHMFEGWGKNYLYE